MKQEKSQAKGFQKEQETVAQRQNRLCQRVAARKYNNYINQIHEELKSGTITIADLLTQQAISNTLLQFLFARNGCGKKIVTPEGKTKWVWNERKINEFIRKESSVLVPTTAIQTMIREHHANLENEQSRKERESEYTTSWHPPLKFDARKFRSGCKRNWEASQGRPKINENRQRMVDMSFIGSVESPKFNSGSRFPAKFKNVRPADVLLYCEAIEKVFLDLAEDCGLIDSHNNFKILPIHKWFGLVKLFNILFQGIAKWRREDSEWEPTLPIFDLSEEELAAWEYRFGWELSW